MSTAQAKAIQQLTGLGSSFVELLYYPLQNCFIILCILTTGCLLPDTTQRTSQHFLQVQGRKLLAQQSITGTQELLLSRWGTHPKAMKNNQAN